MLQPTFSVNVSIFVLMSDRAVPRDNNIRNFNIPFHLERRLFFRLYARLFQIHGTDNRNFMNAPRIDGAGLLVIANKCSPYVCVGYTHYLSEENS